MADSKKIMWSDKGVHLVLEMLKPRESLWNSKSLNYRDRDVKKREYTEILDAVKEDIENVDLAGLKAKIQSLRTTFRDEMRKVKKSQGTGSGANELYESHWKFFSSCKFLEEVILSSKPTFSNQDASEDLDDSVISLDEEESKSGENKDQHPKRRRNSKQWMDTAANALAEIASLKDVEEDEWDVFGRDVANSIRSIKNTYTQRRLKFAIQTAIFQATSQLEESQMAPLAPIPTQHSTNYYDGQHYSF